MPPAVMIRSFFPVRDFQKTLRVQFPDISGMHPPVLLQDLGRGLGVLEVALEDVSPPEADLSVFGDLYLDPRKGLPDRSDLHPVSLVGAGDAGALGHPVPFPERNADRLEKPEHVRRDRRGAGKGQTHPVEPQTLLQFPEGGEVGQGIGGAQARRGIG